MSTEGTPQVEDREKSQKAAARDERQARHERGFSRDRMPSARRNVRINPLDHFPIHFQDKTQYTVRRWMLRTKV